MKENFFSKIATASGSAAKSFLGLSSQTSDYLHAGSYRNSMGLTNKSGWLFDNPAPGIDTYFSFSGLDDVVKAYEGCAPVFSIINKQAIEFITGKTFVLNSKNREVQSEYAKKVRALLAKPNALQTGKQFEAQMVIYLRLFRYCIILPIKPKGYENEDSTAMWIIPPYMCEFEFAKETFYNLKRGFITKIKVKYGDEESTLNPEDVIIIRDIQPGFNSLYIPDSPIKPLQQNISNLIGISNSKGQLIHYRGALGILTPEQDPNGALSVTPTENDDLHRQFQVYGLKAGQRKFIIANSAMKWQQMGLSYRELMLTEWYQDDVMVVADGLNYQYRLLATNAVSSMNGTEYDSYKKKQYEDFTLPFADMIYEQMGESFNAEKNGCVIVKDYSHVPVLQKDAQLTATARKTRNDALQIEFLNNLIPLNRWLVLNDEEEMAGDMAEMGKKYYWQLVKEGWAFGKAGMTLSDLTQSNTQPQNSTNP